MVFKLITTMLQATDGGATPAAPGSITDTYNATQDVNIIDAPAPRPDQLPMGSSRNTWPNIVNNKRTVIFCTTQFSYLRNRENCIHDFTGGPLLA
ncbi:hypothetical protein GUITHDRAFT_152730 [Guillardia theta CCMP2712]|uniref:Uncharacterized protein n=1 Tax=Guillardia theta (strain CCMP2712) TaxID=905079 RepID=L1JBM3_GUITC|nr:hypothetical protein GUITHDRAFT_152730 [Guillardia theta CCMP2712]EKX45490.1 hypothetical protein GUITHDRAFT_152730 [Guillardia theta CCMP2712]|mmetsp:Transcript_27832/g.90522  ORF Transcript_27832/g.90522 Transcript_27832/m.90522 type:complete len:95 (+) Transcript_27832:332-616(+)|eukprot:XP_005832470.1 hypothetical protein GUITHDRAFT_152730 [Guillardia theta CCMP2712]